MIPEVDFLLIGMAERYDVMVTAGGSVPVYSRKPRKRAGACMLPYITDPQFRPDELSGESGYRECSPPQTVTWVTTTTSVTLGGTMCRRGQSTGTLQRPIHCVPAGLTANLMFVTPPHDVAIHHGHTFQDDQGQAARCPRDTVIVLPKRRARGAPVPTIPGVWWSATLLQQPNYHQVPEWRHLSIL